MGQADGTVCRINAVVGSLQPVEYSLPFKTVCCASDRNFSLALDVNGSVVNINTATIIFPQILPKIISVSCSSNNFVLLVDQFSNVWGYGENAKGQLGIE